MTPAAPARVFVIRARDGKTATIFRRGPSKLTQMLQWNLKKDIITPGQWVKLAVYPRRSDLSPDGQHLIYFAATHMGGESSNWTAISRPPYWTALHLYGQYHAWNGGGVFEDNRHFWPNLGIGSATKAKVASGLVRLQRPPDWITPTGGEDMVIYLPRLVRDGWTPEGEENSGKGSFRRTTTWLFSKVVREKWLLRKRVVASLVHKGPYGEVYWETHSLIGPEREIDLDDEWADVDGRSVIYTSKGKLFRMAVHRKGPDEPISIADLTPNRFNRVVAPYAGLSRT